MTQEEPVLEEKLKKIFNVDGIRILAYIYEKGSSTYADFPRSSRPSLVKQANVLREYGIIRMRMEATYRGPSRVIMTLDTGYKGGYWTQKRKEALEIIINDK